MSENFGLNDVMEGNTPRRSSTTVVDLTGSKPVVQGNGAVDQPNPVQRKAVPIHSGPIDMETMKPVDINAILPKREPEPNAMENSMMADLDAAVARECESISKRHEELFATLHKEFEDEEAKKEEAMLAAEDDFALNGSSATNYDYETSTTTASASYNNRFNLGIDEEDSDDVNDIEDEYPVPTTVDTTGTGLTTIRNNDKGLVNILDNVNNEDLFDEEEEEAVANTSEPTTEELIDDLKGQIKERVTPIRKTLDLSKFSIAKKAISAQKVMKLAVHSHQNVADWVLPSAGRAISMTGLSGPEILKLNPENSNRNRINTFRDMYRVIYDHVFDGNKPDYETWLKQLRFVDLQHVYFALYMATFGGSNFINYSCPKCNKVFIKDIDFKNMVVYADDETKTKIQNILKMDTTSESNDSYNMELVQVSDSYVFGMRTPSVWNVIMETASLSDQFLEKHSDLIDMVAYIDSAYIIDHNNNQLIPVDTKPDPNDMAKSAARRIKAMYDIISTMSSEEYYSLRAAINDFDADVDKVSYKIPGCTCPHCNTEIPDNTNITPDAMLFTRHQLAAIGSM